MRASSFVVLLAVLISYPTAALACPAGQYRDGLFGACLPKIGGTPGKVFEQAKGEIKGQLGGPLLEQYIIQSRNDAIRFASPMPPHIRQALTGYASQDSMNKVRFRIQDNGVLNLAHL